MKYEKFNSSRSTKIEFLYEHYDTVCIKTKDDQIYMDCDIRWEQGRTRSTEFDNYRFVTKNEQVIWPEDVAYIVEDTEESNSSTLKVYELKMGRWGAVVVIAASIEEAHHLMIKNHDDVDSSDFDNITVHDLRGYTFVTYGEM